MKIADLVDLKTCTCFITVRREGVAAALGHDLRIEVTRHTLSEAGDTVTAEFDATSLKVVGALDPSGRLKSGDVSQKDQATIESNIRDKVLETKRHPQIRFQTTQVTETPTGYTVEGTLDLHGKTNPIRLAATEQNGAWVARVTLHQPTWNITPYRGLLGALRVQPDVDVEVSAKLR